MGTIINKTPLQIEPKRPKVSVTIGTPNGSIYQMTNFDIDSAINSISVSKNLKNRTGNFSMSVNESFLNKISINTKNNKNANITTQFILENMKKKNYQAVFPLKSFVQIKINNTVVMDGFINNVARSYNRNAKTKMLKISGNDVSEIFKKFKRFWTAYQTSPFNNTNFDKRADIQNLASNTIQGIFEEIYNRWMNVIYEGSTGTWKVFDKNGKQVKLSDLLIVDQAIMPTELYTNEFSRYFSSYNSDGDFFSIFDQYISKPFHEMWITTGGKSITVGKGETLNLEEGKSYLILRPSPFSSNTYNVDNELNANSTPSLLDIEDLETYIINDNNIISKDLYYADEEDLYSCYAVHITGTSFEPEAIEMITDALWDERMFGLTGYNPMIATVDALSASETSKYDILDKNKLQYMLKKWFRYNDMDLKGTIKVRGDEKIHEGIAVKYDKIDKVEKIENETEERTYYCYGFMHSWTFGKEFSTTLNVERGMRNYTPDEIQGA